MEKIECPQCGYPLPIYFRYSKLAVCPSCKSTIFLEDESARLSGKSSVLSEEPSLLKLYRPFSYDRRGFTPVGHIRYRSGRFAWDEWRLVDNRGKEWWISVDDGDYILEKKVPFSLEIDSFETLRLGSEVGEWRVTELGEGICEGFEGEFPNIVKEGERHRFVHLSGKGRIMLTAEFFDDVKELYEGRWIDPYEIWARM
jgi:hypothetical protein